MTPRPILAPVSSRTPQSRLRYDDSGVHAFRGHQRRARVASLARECGFELAGVAPAFPADDRERYQRWVAAGLAGDMAYLTDRRAEVRNDPRNLLPSARSIVCVGKLYNGPQPYSTKFR